MNPEQVLQQIGLTEAEVKLYMKLLSLGEATASTLAGKTATNRTFTYDRLNKLVNLGLASHVIKDDKKYFKSADPSQFLELLNERKFQVQSILPELQSLKAETSLAPQATLFSSKKGVQTVLNLMLKEKKQVFAHGSIISFKSIMKEGFEIWNQRRIKQKIRLKILTSEDIILDYADVQQLPEEEKTDVTTFTFGSKTIVAFWSDVPVAILIESMEIAKGNISFFSTVWNREINIYTGVDGIIKAFYELIENKNGYYLGVGYSAALAKVYGTKISDKWHEVRLKNKVNARLIAYNDSDSIDYFKIRSKKWKDFNIRFLDKTICGPACATISDNLMATFIYTEGSFKVILNRNKETINAYKRYFEQLWKLAKEG